MPKSIKVLYPVDNDKIVYKRRIQVLEVRPGESGVTVRSSANGRWLASFGNVGHFLHYHQFNSVTKHWEQKYGSGF